MHGGGEGGGRAGTSSPHPPVITTSASALLPAEPCPLLEKGHLGFCGKWSREFRNFTQFKFSCHL